MSLLKHLGSNLIIIDNLLGTLEHIRVSVSLTCPLGHGDVLDIRRPRITLGSQSISVVALSNTGDVHCVMERLVKIEQRLLNRLLSRSVLFAISILTLGYLLCALFADWCIPRFNLGVTGFIKSTLGPELTAHVAVASFTQALNLIFSSRLALSGLCNRHFLRRSRLIRCGSFVT